MTVVAMLTVVCVSAQRECENLNFGWEFRLNDEGDWRKVDVPHDFLKSGWKIKFDFSGNIQIVNPEMLGLAKGATLTSGQFYELLTPGNLELLLNSSYSPLLIKSITVVAPETEDPTAISRLQADEEAGDTYDLSGRKVDTSVRLPKGVYIRNGKKIVLK